MGRLARRVHEVAGWHTELYIDARTIDDDLSARIAKLPVVSIDHLGMHSGGPTNPLLLVEHGVKVKAFAAAESGTRRKDACHRRRVLRRCHSPADTPFGARWSGSSVRM